MPFEPDTDRVQADRDDQCQEFLQTAGRVANHQIATDVAEQQLLPDWSPDGGRLVFTTRGRSTEPLYEYDLAKGESRQLFECTDPCVGDDEPAYSPDGRKVAFVRALGPFVGEVGYGASYPLRGI
jgi:Tol biopolymer transport system component